ncbi:MAG: cytochrome o ubiquinol oxidase subunit IV [Betaproteobacteria bacterium]|jgi:cytochrome o ubiquinol oxidase subunit IV|nr:cytochrome o ubiquinol oxidase subunit IV [Betaproteobacteria bacterium]
MKIHHSSLSKTFTGFVLSLILTLGAFSIARGWTDLASTMRHVLLVLLALIQILVQLRYFLHLDGSPDQRWKRWTLWYTVLIALLLLGGTLWIMHNAQMHMMAGMESS